MGFVFFDTETTGLERGFDQIVHFAAIQTDPFLNETGRFEVRSYLQPHIVPHPAALIANGLPISQLTDRTLSSYYDMTCAIRRQMLAWSPAIIAGFNSIGFDEEMLRHGFFQNLHPAYLTSNHQNARADVLSLVMAASAMTPACIAVPAGADGRPSFRLELIAAANGITHAKAHDAMSDAQATLDLCRLVRDRADDVWQRFMRFSKKATVAEFVETEDGFVLSEFYGGGQAYHTPVVMIGLEPKNPNGRFCLSLATDPSEWARMSDQDLGLALARKGTPVRRLRVNAAPTLTELNDASPELLGGLTVEIAEARAHQLRGDPALRARIIAAYTASWKEPQPSPHPEARLYDGGFPGPDDEERMSTFHQSTWTRKLEITEAFDDPRLKAFGRRLIYGGRRSILPPDVRRQADLDLCDCLLEDQGGHRTLLQALEEADRLISERSHPEPILRDYRAYLLNRIDDVRRFQAQCTAEATLTGA
jgi:exodeoxyribonuclease-1